MLSKYYIFHTSYDYVDAVCSIIKFVGGSVNTIITHRENLEGSINYYRVYCRLLNYCVSNVSTSSYTNWHGTGSSRTTHHQASERSNEIWFDDILGKETEKLCQLEK